jgi:uncharacterized membrane protein
VSQTRTPTTDRGRRGRPPRLPGLLLGAGLGGFIDGIVFHQILQWHHMLTDTGGHPATTVTGLRTNTLADGLFHAGTWVAVLVGSTMMFQAWRAGRLPPPARAYVGLLGAGWGIFNVVEGLIDHHLLGIHHVRDDLGGPLVWDLAFLVFGAVLLSGGLTLSRARRT